MKSLISVIQEKDCHIKALQEKLSDLGGSYFPRKHKDALDSFNEENWRDVQRKLIRNAGEETGLQVFQRWGKLGEEERMDWEAAVQGLGKWSRDDEVFPFRIY
jgi:hypothetical protein